MMRLGDAGVEVVADLLQPVNLRSSQRLVELPPLPKKLKCLHALVEL